MSNNETVIAEGVRVDGDFMSQGNVAIDGEMTGSIQTVAALRVGPAAKIQAEVKAGSALIAGQVVGNIKATERIDLTDTAVINGDLEAPVLSVAAGAKISGRVTTGVEPTAN